jgi:hypothetical protein
MKSSGCSARSAIFVVLLLCHATLVAAQDPPFARGSRTRGLVGGWGAGYHPPWAVAHSDVTFAALHPRMGWFIEDRIELYGEATFFLYTEPASEITAGLGGLAGRLYLRDSGSWIPYLHGGIGLLWTTLEIRNIDSIFNYQHFIGIGWRQNRVRGPRLVLELRNHHISNAGTAGKNLGVNALVALSGVEWVLR